MWDAHTSCTELNELPEVETALCGEAMFVKGDEKLTRLVPRTDIHQVLQQVAQSLAKLPSPNLIADLAGTAPFRAPRAKPRGRAVQGQGAAPTASANAVT